MVRSFNGVFTLKAAAQEAAEASLAKGEEASHFDVMQSLVRG